MNVSPVSRARCLPRRIMNSYCNCNHRHGSINLARNIPSVTRFEWEAAISGIILRTISGGEVTDGARPWYFTELNVLPGRYWPRWNFAEAPRGWYLRRKAGERLRVPRGDFREAAARQIAASYAGRGKESVMSSLLFIAPPLPFRRFLPRRWQRRRQWRRWS